MILTIRLLFRILFLLTTLVSTCKGVDLELLNEKLDSEAHQLSATLALPKQSILKLYLGVHDFNDIVNSLIILDEINKKQYPVLWMGINHNLAIYYSNRKQMEKSKEYFKKYSREKNNVFPDYYKKYRINFCKNILANFDDENYVFKNCRDTLKLLDDTETGVVNKHTSPVQYFDILLSILDKQLTLLHWDNAETTINKIISLRLLLISKNSKSKPEGTEKIITTIIFDIPKICAFVKIKIHKYEEAFKCLFLGGYGDTQPNKLFKYLSTESDGNYNYDQVSRKLTRDFDTAKYLKNFEVLGNKSLWSINDMDIYKWLNTMSIQSLLVKPVTTKYGTIVFLVSRKDKAINKNNIIEIKNLNEGYIFDLVGDYWDLYKILKNVKEKKIEYTERFLRIGMDGLQEVISKPIFKHVKYRKAKYIYLSNSHLNDFPYLECIDLQCQRKKINYINNIKRTYEASNIKEQVDLKEKSSLLILNNTDQSLKYSNLEASLIKKFFLNEDTTEYNHENYSKVRILKSIAQNGMYLHISLHGIVEPTSPSFSRFILSKTENITATDLLKQKSINYDLVTLSSCEVGKSGISYSYENTLKNILIEKGVNVVISSLWRIDEIPSSFFYYKLYESIVLDKKPIIDSVYLAKDWLKNATFKQLKDMLTMHMSKNRDVSPRNALLLHKLRKLARIFPTKKPYSKFYFWGSFTYSGKYIK